MSPGAPKGNQNARKHGVWSTLLTQEDQEFLAADPGERLATLQGLAELRAFRAHQAAMGGVVDAALDVAFARNVAQAANLARTRLALAEKAAEGIRPEGSGEENEFSDVEVTDRERVQGLVALLDTGAAGEDGGTAGAPDVVPDQPGPD